MKAKRILRKIGRVCLILLAVLLALWLIIFVNSKIRLSRDRAFLEAQGYCNPVSAGEYDVNVLTFGNANGRHRIIAMAGYGCPDICITMRRMTAYLETDNQVVFVDRAGYGISDDTDREITAEHVVEAYRTALRNAGIPAPYVLMPHSIGGIYATLWESKYPEEVEAVAIIDGTELEAIPAEIQQTEVIPEVYLYYRLDRLGLGGTGNLLLRHFQPPKDWLTEDEQRMEYALTLMTFDSRALIAEDAAFERNIDSVWRETVTNSIPKIYISTEYLTAEDIEADGVLTDELADELMAERRELRARLEEQYQSGAITEEKYLELLPALPQNDAEKRQMALDDLLAQGRDYCDSMLTPYFEKLGNCRLVNLPGDHLIYEYKPDECGQIIKAFLDELDA